MKMLKRLVSRLVSCFAKPSAATLPPPRKQCDDLVAFIDGELSKQRMRDFRTHLRECEPCRKNLVEMVQLQAQLSTGWNDPGFDVDLDPELPDGQIGYLTEGFHVVCMLCVPEMIGPNDARLYRVIIGSYRQTCHVCHKVLVEGQSEKWPELYPNLWKTDTK